MNYVLNDSRPSQKYVPKVRSDIVVTDFYIIDGYQAESESEEEKIINKASAYIVKQITNNLTINDYAAHVHLSPSHFARMFKKTKGLTVHQFVIRKKIRLAEHMLLQNRRVNEVAAALGYENRRYFSSLFKKINGLTPSEFKRAKGG